MKITKQQLYNLIDEPYLSRGEGYFAEGMVALTSIGDNKISAESVGSRLYKINMRFKNGSLRGNCTCPAFESFGPCKHMAATGFALIAHNKGGYEPSEEFQYRKEESDRFVQFLISKNKEELVDIIMQAVNDDPDMMYILGLEDEEEQWA